MLVFPALHEMSSSIEQGKQVAVSLNTKSLVVEVTRKVKNSFCRYFISRLAYT